MSLSLLCRVLSSLSFPVTSSVSLQRIKSSWPDTATINPYVITLKESKDYAKNPSCLREFSLPLLSAGDNPVLLLFLYWHEICSL